MKTLITLILLLCFATSASAQDDVHPFAKGTKLAGFSMNTLSQQSDVNGTKTELTGGILNGQFGYFVVDGLVLGIDVQSMVSNSDVNGEFGESTDETVQSSLGIFAAYYFRIGEKSAIYPEIRVYAGRSETEYEDSFGGSGRDEMDMTGSSVGLGYAYRINQNIGLDVKLRAGRETSISSSNSGDDLEIDWSTGLFLVGFQIFF